MKYFVTVFTCLLIGLLFLDTCSFENVSKETIIQEIEQEIELLDDVKVLLSHEDAALLSKLKEQFNMESVRKDMAELKKLQQELQNLKKSAVKQHKDGDSDKVELLADFTLIPENLSSSEFDKKTIATESDSGPSGYMVKNEMKTGPVKYKKGHIPALNVSLIKCSLELLIGKYELVMILKRVGEDNNNYLLFDPVSKSFSPLTEAVLNTFSNRGYRQYHTAEDNMWKLKVETYLGSIIEPIGWAYPKKAEQKLISKQLAYCQSINKQPEEIDITYGYYDIQGELVLTDWK